MQPRAGRRGGSRQRRLSERLQYALGHAISRLAMLRKNVPQIGILRPQCFGERLALSARGQVLFERRGLVAAKLAVDPAADLLTSGIAVHVIISALRSVARAAW